MFAVWLAVVSYLAWVHLVWRDEVRALSLALQGNNVIAMLRGVHGEGHPALWYLLLRGTHTLVTSPKVLLLVSIIVVASAILLLVLRSPFSLPFVALTMFGRFSIYEYSVLARDYGISMLMLFLFAALYKRHWNRGCLLGVVLFLLANCNVHSVFFVVGLLVFWLVDILSSAADRPRLLRLYLYNSALAAIGIAACFLTVFPTFNDAALNSKSGGISFGVLFTGLALPGKQFIDVCFPGLLKLAKAVPLFGKPAVLWIIWILSSLVMFGSTLGLIRRTGAFLAALMSLFGLSLFFTAISPGGYRHQALWIVFMICIYWMAVPVDGRDATAPSDWRKPMTASLSRCGMSFFLLLLLLQLPAVSYKVIGIALNREQNASSVFVSHPELKQAVIIADPDFLVEALPYYVSNPTYLIREQRYGNAVRFTSKALLDLSLDDVLANARRLRQVTGKPVVILLCQKIDPSQPATVYPEGYDWTLSVTPQQARTFLSSTKLIERYAPVQTDEVYSVYVLDQ
jgi:hypothetical protein